MPKMSEITESLVKHLLIFGPPKAGKTKLVGELAEHFNLHWLDFEFGSDTLKQLPMQWQEKIEIYRIKDSKSFPMAVETLTKLFTVKTGTICAEHGKFNCAICKKAVTDGKLMISEMWPIDITKFGPTDILVIDSWTQVVLSAIGNITRNKPDDYKMEFDDWMHLKQIIENLGTFIQAAPFHVAVISHEDVVQMVDKTEKIVPVGGSSKTSRNFAKYFGEVIYMEVMNKKHKASSSTVAKANVLTGSRAQAILENDATPRLATVFGK